MKPAVGFFGKLPSHGDFLERGVSAQFREVWDAWLERCIDSSRRGLGDRWLDCYLTSPIWRFFLCDGVAGSVSYAGVLLPSVDRVGRYFPLTVVVELPAGIAAMEFAMAAADWFDELEPLCAAAVENPEVDLRTFEENLSASSDRLTTLDHLSAPLQFPGHSPQWRWPVASTRELSAALGAPLMAAAHATLRPMTMWWTDGSERVESSVLLARGLPRPESFRALLEGGWDDGQWDGIVTQGLSSAAKDWRASSGNTDSLLAADFAVHGAGVTDVGTVRAQNQDNLMLNDEYRIWAVADGMGGHSHGEVASQMVVDALNNLPAAATLNGALEAVSIALSRVNEDLRRTALREGERSGATVVALLIRGSDWALSWAGDSRAYLYRGGGLTQLTRDHTVVAELAAATGDAPTATTGEITRAVGGDDVLVLDHASDALMDGDRFLLCSDGLYGALDERVLAHYMGLETPEMASRGLIDAACQAGAVDNLTALIVDARERRD